MQHSMNMYICSQTAVQSSSDLIKRFIFSNRLLLFRFYFFFLLFLRLMNKEKWTADNINSSTRLHWNYYYFFFFIFQKFPVNDEYSSFHFDVILMKYKWPIFLHSFIICYLHYLNYSIPSCLFEIFWSSVPVDICDYFSIMFLTNYLKFTFMTMHIERIVLIM